MVARTWEGWGTIFILQSLFFVEICISLRVHTWNFVYAGEFIKNNPHKTPTVNGEEGDKMCSTVYLTVLIRFEFSSRLSKRRAHQKDYWS